MTKNERDETKAGLETPLVGDPYGVMYARGSPSPRPDEKAPKAPVRIYFPYDEVRAELDRRDERILPSVDTEW